MENEKMHFLGNFSCGPGVSRQLAGHLSWKVEGRWPVYCRLTPAFRLPGGDGGRERAGFFRMSIKWEEDGGKVGGTALEIKKIFYFRGQNEFELLSK